MLNIKVFIKVYLKILEIKNIDFIIALLLLQKV